MIKAPEHYPISENERAHAEALKAKYEKHVSKLSDFDKGRIHAACYITAMLKEHGHAEGSKHVDKFLRWLGDDKETTIGKILTGDK